jgi:hypothetical protein
MVQTTNIKHLSIVNAIYLANHLNPKNQGSDNYHI